MNPVFLRLDRDRKGALLLLVLGMLTLFLMMGALGLALAVRARETSRAFASAAVSEAGNSQLARSLLDEALLKLLRGPVLPGKLSETLLGDKYGSGVAAAGSMSSIAPVADSPFLSATITGVDTAKPLALAGRIVTLKPRSDDLTEASSYRIVRVTGGTTFLLANMRPATPVPLPTKFPCPVFINGREFDGSAGNEPYDAFDAENAFLAQPKYGGDRQITSIVRPSFSTSSATADVDNDNDGVADGIWLEGVLPDLRSPNGGTLKCAVSYFVIDMDGKLNLNAHGSLPPGGGNGNGPADVDGASLLTGSTWQAVMKGADPPYGSANSSDQQRRPPPALAVPVQGRYGAVASPQPYEVRLDGDGVRSLLLSGTQPIPNLFGVSELEAVLRQFDPDVRSLPFRLARILDSESQRCRMIVTTEAWDTPSVTGTTARKMFHDNADIDATKLSPDVASGVRFNLNRRWPEDATEATTAKQKYFEDLYYVLVAMGVPAGTTTAQWAANIVDYRDGDTAATTFQIPATEGQESPGSVTGVEPSNHPSIAPPGGWDRDFGSPADLLGIPQLADADLEQQLKASPPADIFSLVKAYPAILDAMLVPSPFKGAYADFSPAKLAAAEMGDLPDKQLSRWREAGRINVNTAHEDVWKQLIGDSSVDNPFAPAGESAGSPAKTGLELMSPTLVFDTGIHKEFDIRSIRHPRARRLGGLGTNRSQVFAVWITLRVTDDSANAEQPSFHRLFAIVDRSIPVGYSPGLNLNVREAIRLQRFVE